MNVQKLSMCRICLVQNVRMHVVANKNLQEIYEKLTDFPLLTEDRRPMLACFLCSNRLKQCYQLQRKCLVSEKLFAQILNEDHEAKPLLDQGQLQFSGFIISPTEQISISGECPADCGLVINENIPADCNGQDDKVGIKEEHQSDTETESEQEFQGKQYLNSYSDREELLPQLELGVILPHHSASGSEDEPPLMELKTEDEEEKEVSKKKRQAIKTTSASGVNKPKLDPLRAKPEVTVTILPKQTIRKSYNCDVCQRSFSQKSDFTTHMRVHTGEKPFICDVCQRRFRVKCHLTRHMFEHTGEKPYKCDVCQSSFSEMSGLTRHSRLHTGEKPFKCDMCQRSYSERSKLTIHMRVHSGEKPFSCEVCQRCFSERGQLTKHMRVHTGEKPFRCNLCQRSFSLKSNLRSHMRVHTGEKPFNCEVCQRSFRDNTSLRNHLRLHTGEKPFKCEVCQLRFRYSSYLKKHKLQIHMTGSTS